MVYRKHSPPFNCPECGTRLKEIFASHFKCPNQKCGNRYMIFPKKEKELRQKTVKDFLI